MTSLSLSRHWLQGRCWSEHGPRLCFFRHYYLPRDTVTSTTTADHLNPENGNEVVFTSPLTVQVYEEVTKTRKEEVDLDTGRRRSFVEEKRFEVLDLTGETPRRRGSQRTPLRSLNNQVQLETRRHSSKAEESVLCLSSPVPGPYPEKTHVLTMSGVILMIFPTCDI